MMRRLSLLILCAVLLAGCSDRSFVGRRYDNFTAYYNTFHNAQKAFEKGVQSMEQRNRPIDRTHYLEVFSVPRRGVGGDVFERAINKSADVLRDHPNSKWVDDALMLIGKSYFYQRNHVGAEQKFREVISLGSGLEGEARFWLARALIAAGRYENAAEHLRVSLSQSEDFGRWTDLLYLARGALYVEQSNWSAAAEALTRGLDGEVEDEVAARAAFLLGQVRETLGNYAGAARAYDQAASYRSRYELNYAAQLSAIRVKGMHGAPEEALHALREMEGDDKNFEKRAELQLARAQLYQADGRVEAAQGIYRDLLYGDDAVRGAVSGRVHYALAELHRDAFENYSIAAAHFDTAATSIGGMGGRASPNQQSDQQQAPAAITDSRQQANLFGEVADRAQTVARLDSLLRLGTMEEEEFQEFVAELRKKRAEEQAARERRRREQRASRRFTQQGPAGQRDNANRDGAAETAAATRESDAGFLFHNDPVRIQESRRRFEQQWGSRPLVPNWRRRTAIRTQTASDEASEDGPAVVADSIGRGQRPPGAAAAPGGQALVNVSAVPRDSAGQAQMRAERAVARYELANALFLSVSRPDSAITWYRKVVEEDANQPVAQRALYALAEAHTAKGDTARARSIYRRVIEQYPSSEFADRARERLGENVNSPVPTSPVPTDTTALAETAYANAYDAWQQNRHDEALRRMVRVVEQYPRTNVAPRALLAAGSIFMEQRPSNSLNATTPLPEMFTSILEAQPKTASPADSKGRPAAPPDSAQTSRSSALPDTTAIRRTSARPDSARRSPTLELSDRERAIMTDAQSASQSADSLSTRSAPDSLLADSVTTNAGSPAADSLAADSLTADSLAADSLAMGAQMTLLVRTDSLMGGAGSEQTEQSDSTKTSSGPVLRTLFAHLTKRYPRSAQARRAERLLVALDEATEAEAAGAAPSDTLRRPSPATDSTAADSVRASVPTNADTTSSAPADTLSPDAAAADTIATPPPDTAAAPSPGDTLISPEADTASADDQPLPAPRVAPRGSDSTSSDTTSTLPGPAPPPDSTEQRRN